MDAPNASTYLYNFTQFCMHGKCATASNAVIDGLNHGRELLGCDIYDVLYTGNPKKENLKGWKDQFAKRGSYVYILGILGTIIDIAQGIIDTEDPSYADIEWGSVTNSNAKGYETKHAGINLHDKYDECKTNFWQNTHDNINAIHDNFGPEKLDH